MLWQCLNIVVWLVDILQIVSALKISLVVNIFCLGVSFLHLFLKFTNILQENLFSD
jgi:hypothetical protein